MTNKLSQIEINSFRGIRNLKIDNLGKFNIITGNNNSGKTSFLEALMLLTQPNLYNILKVARVREANKFMFRSRLDSFSSFNYLFNRQNEKLNIGINGIYNNKDIKLIIEGEFKKELINENMIRDYIKFPNKKNMIIEEVIPFDEEIESFVGKHMFSLIKNDNSFEQVEKELYLNKYNTNRLLNTDSSNGFVTEYQYISSMDHIIKDNLNPIIKNLEYKKEVIDILKIFDEDIEDLMILPEGENNYIHSVNSKINGLMPISSYGDGIKKILALAAGIVRAKNGILLVDEIETSIHKKAMPRIFHWLIEACNKFNVQLFLTTHSIEAVDEILNSNSKAIENNWLRVVTLMKKNKSTYARLLTGNDALQLRDDFDLELRQ
ncbi:AAA family ATPase [Lysinibacillus sphaericus]|uniref:AAA family ATPase n=1 Tax=Lysinibacillus sphaericus TaxID=1421 RepID=UPI00248C0AB1|nr:ATP-binding protein [Lysinibacillus sphaericus]